MFLYKKTNEAPAKQMPRIVLKLLQSLFDCDSNANGHTHHRIVTCAQEAHHLNVKSACRRLWACGAGAF
jgi:hypothetical protein